MIENAQGNRIESEFGCVPFGLAKRFFGITLSPEGLKKDEVENERFRSTRSLNHGQKEKPHLRVVLLNREQMMTLRRQSLGK